METNVKIPPAMIHELIELWNNPFYMKEKYKTWHAGEGEK